MATMNKSKEEDGGDDRPGAGGDAKLPNESNSETFGSVSGTATMPCEAHAMEEKTQGQENDVCISGVEADSNHVTVRDAGTPRVDVVFTSLQSSDASCLQQNPRRSESFASEFPVTTIPISGKAAGETENNTNEENNTTTKSREDTPPASVPGAVAVSSTLLSDRPVETDDVFASEFPATRSETVCSGSNTLLADEREHKSKFATNPFISSAGAAGTVPSFASMNFDADISDEEKTQEVESVRYDSDITPSPLVRHPGGRVRYSEDLSGDAKNQRNFQLVERIAGPNLPPSEEGDEPGGETSVHSRSVESPQDVVLAAELVPAEVLHRTVEAQNVEPIHRDEKPPSYQFRWWVLPGILLLVIIIAVVVVTVVLVVMGNQGNDPALTTLSPTVTLTPSRSPSFSPTLNPTDTLTPSMSPSTSPTLTPSLFPSMAPTWSPEKQLVHLESLTLPISGDAIYQEGTPQSKALSWLSQRDLSGTDADSKLVELYALAVLYYATNGPSWSRDRGFLSSNEACGWNGGSTGAFCNNAATVNEIKLDYEELQGTIPDELAALTALRVIRMNNNDLSGTIPPSFGNLTMLETLDLNLNSLTGTIPTAIRALPALKHFDARSNSVTGGISSFASQQLSELHLYGNQLNGSLEGFFNSTGLAELRIISFSSNQLTGSMPATVGNFAQLERIWLSNNDLTGTLPTEIGLLTNLTYLDLDDNDLSGTVPVELENCARLRSLHLRRCGLGGSFPSSVAHLSSLVSLSIQGNNFTNDLDETFCTREDSIWLVASCLEDTVVCPCCSRCCNATGYDCVSN